VVARRAHRAVRRAAEGTPTRPTPTRGDRSASCTPRSVSGRATPRPLV